METISILGCTNCGRIVDQYTMIPRCKRCGTNRFRLLKPTVYTLLCWAINEPKHFLGLLKQDIREKYHDKKGS